MSSQFGRDGIDRPKKKNHARPDRIIEKRQNWQDYLDPDEDPGLMDDDNELLLDEDDINDLSPEEGSPEE